MDKSALSGIFSKIVFAIFVIALIDIIYLNWWVFKSNKSQSTPTNQPKVTDVVDKAVVTTPSPGIDKLAVSPTPNAAVQQTPPQTIIERTQTVVQNAQKEIFIPIGSGSGYSNNFADIPGLEVTIDATKYSAIDSVVFQGSVWVEGGNGKAYAQLYNVDDKNQIYESQISNNTGVSTLQTSNNMNLPYSTKTYRVQVKTNITQYAAHIDNARIKITLK